MRILNYKFEVYYLKISLKKIRVENSKQKLKLIVKNFFY